VVLAARSDSVRRREALETLCGTYWLPIYSYLRRRGNAPADAEDLTQGFFVKLLNDETLEQADTGKGRLRSYLLAALNRHLADDLRHRTALKRGGGQPSIAFEEMNAEERYKHEPVDSRGPEQLFTGVWARQLLAGVREQLRKDFADTRRPELFDTLLPFLLLDEEPPSYREVAAQLKATEVSVRLMVSRLRARFRGLLREEVARTVASPEELESELEWLKSALLAP
jgi:RNA polymerase sigma-70 factor (ECF subfamily)